MVGTSINVHLNDISDALLSNIFSLVTDTRTRNAMSLVCLKWHLLERSTRTSLILRGTNRDLFLLPTCFRAVNNLDLSFLSPWGHPLLDSSLDPALLAQLLRLAFPLVVSLTVYVRNPSILHFLAPQWPNLQHIKLICWHQRVPTKPVGSDFNALFEHFPSLSSLDVSHFYCWTEDLPLAIKSFPLSVASLSHLNILKHSSTDGFKSHELLSITASCPNLRMFLATCIFDRRFIGFLDDQTLLSLASNCPFLSLLHLVDAKSSSDVRANPNDDGYTSGDASISNAMFASVFAKLPLLEELVLDVCHNVRNVWSGLELLNSKCKKLKSIKLGQFHGVCRGIDSNPNGIALCQGLESLSIKNSADLNDSVLEAISFGCRRLSKLEVNGCKRITRTGIMKLSHGLRETLVDVKISCCKNLNAISSLQAVEPIRDRIQRLHIDCVWGVVEQLSNNYGAWRKLSYLSLWIATGEMLTPLSYAGLDDCGALEELKIKIEGDCRNKKRPSINGLGLEYLGCYPRLSRMNLDCSGVIGYALTAPPGSADLSMWERFFLSGIENLHLNELNYWPAQDLDMNHRGLFLPAAGLLARCWSLRKLFIHGTANEHLMMFLPRNPTLRDVQLREDYYPAPENEMSTEMRVESCYRFEDALNSPQRQVPA